MRADLSCVCINYSVCGHVKSLQSCLTLWAPIGCSSPGSSVQGILQAKYWSGFPCPPPGDLLNSGAEPASLESPALAGGFFTTNDIWEAHINYRHLLYCLAAFLHLWRQKDFNSLPNTNKAKCSVMRVHKETVGQEKMEVSSEPWKKLQEELRTKDCHLHQENWAGPPRLCWLPQSTKPKCQSPHLRTVSVPTTKPFIQSSSMH